MIIHSDNKALKLSEKVDKDGILYYTFYLKPPVWEANKEMVEGDIISPSSPTGYYYIVVSSGLTGATEPTWTTTKSSRTTDNTVIFKALNNNAYLLSSGTLDTINSTFTVTDSVPIVDTLFNANGKAEVKVGPVPAGVSQFTITFKFFVNSGHAENEYDETSVIVKVTEL